MLEYYSDLNEGLGEGCAYRGRLLISVKTELLDADMASASTVYKDKVRSANKVSVFCFCNCNCKAYIPPERKIPGVGGWRWAVPPTPEFCVGDTNMLVSWSQRKPWRRE